MAKSSQGIDGLVRASTGTILLIWYGEAGL